MKHAATSRSRQHKEISVTEARKHLGDVFGAVNYKKERFVLTNYKKRVAIVPIDDLEILEALEDADDIYEAILAFHEIKEKGSIPFDEMKRLFG